MAWDELTEIFRGGMDMVRRNNAAQRQSFIDDGPADLREQQIQYQEQVYLAVSVITAKNRVLVQLEAAKAQQLDPALIAELELRYSGLHERAEAAKREAKATIKELLDATDLRTAAEYPESNRAEVLQLLQELRSDQAQMSFPAEGRAAELWGEIQGLYFQLLADKRDAPEKPLDDLEERLKSLQAEYDELRRPEEERVKAIRDELHRRLEALRQHL